MTSATTRRYDLYDDSGVKWLGQVPAHWSIKRLKDLWTGSLTNGVFKTRDQFGNGAKLVNVADLYRDNNLIDNAFLDRVNVTDQETTKYGAIDGDIFFVRSSLKLEGIGVSALLANVQEPTVFECHIIRYRPNSRLVYPQFVMYLLNSSIVRSRFIAVSQTVTMTTISQDKIANCELIVPPLYEQQVIADYLDAKTVQIDRRIDLLTQKAEKYRQLKQSVINAAVTRGLDKSVPMKDSGVEWIGKVPAHWQIIRLKDATELRYSNVDKLSQYDETPVALCNYVDVYNNDFIDASLPFMAATANTTEIRRFSLLRHDVLVTKDSETADDIAVPALVLDTLPGVLCGYHLAQLRGKRETMYGPYLFRLFQSDNYGHRFAMRAKGITRVGLSMSAFADALTPIPPFDEQVAISEDIDAKAVQIDGIVNVINTQIDKLKELRKALINDVVTGKLRVT